MKVESLSLVVPSIARINPLERLISSLPKPPDSLKIEVLIIFDGTGEVKFPVDHYPFKVKRYYSTRSFGPSAARNFGSLKALGDWLWFLDDDLYLENFHWESLEELEVDEELACIEGVTRVPCSQGLQERSASKSDFEGGFGSGNILYRRSVFLELGGFDENYFLSGPGLHFREDTDLGLRLLRKGYQSQVNQGIQCVHPSYPSSFLTLCLDARKYFFEAYFLSQNPEGKEWIGGVFHKGRLNTRQTRGGLSLLFIFLLFLPPFYGLIPFLYLILAFLLFKDKRSRLSELPSLLINLFFYPVIHGLSLALGILYAWDRKPVSQILRGQSFEYKELDECLCEEKP